jgi:hypothetical protein
LGSTFWSALDSLFRLNLRCLLSVSDGFNDQLATRNVDLRSFRTVFELTNQNLRLGLFLTSIICFYASAW